MKFSNYKILVYSLSVLFIVSIALIFLITKKKDIFEKLSEYSQTGIIMYGIKNEPIIDSYLFDSGIKIETPVITKKVRLLYNNSLEFRELMKQKGFWR